MNDSDRSRGPRKPIILIGAPSGAGKTVLSQKIIAGALPFFAELCDGASDEAPIRYDLKVLPDDPPCNRVVLIECATHNFEQVAHTVQWQRMIGLAAESERIVHVTIDVPRRTVVRQYFVRIFTGPKRMNVLQRVLNVSKYRNTLIYMLTAQLSKADAAWAEFGKRLAAEMPSRVVIVRVCRSGNGYAVFSQAAPHALGNNPRGWLAASRKRLRMHMS
jgi:hypothetical protein